MHIHPNFDPIAIHLGPLAVRWYGLMYLVGFILAIVVGRLRLRLPYVAALVGWCGEAARVVDVAPALRSYLQPGYRANLAGKIELTDEHDQAVELADSNCLIVIERR